MRSESQPAPASAQAAAPPFGRRDWLIAFLLALATLQTARADFFVNDTFIDWRQYALGHAPLPYQGRAALVPILRWAGNNATFRHMAARYARTVSVGTLFFEPIGPEKFMSLLLGIASLSALMLVAFWWSRRRALSPWWLPNVLLLLILGVTVALRSTTNYWYAYDLPHAALFGIGALLALEGFWPLSLLCFVIDVPLRETSLFSIVMLAPVFFVQGAHLLRSRSLAVGSHRSANYQAPLVAIPHGSASPPTEPAAPAPVHLPETRRDAELTLSFSSLRSPASRPLLLRTAVLATAMALFWAAIRFLIARHYAGNPNQTYPRFSQNLHEILFPHHWPQLFSAGGYLALPIWLERRRLALPERALLLGCAVCVPITLWFGVWTETRVWMEWTLPLAALGSLEAINWLHTRSRLTA